MSFSPNYEYHENYESYSEQDSIAYPDTQIGFWHYFLGKIIFIITTKIFIFMQIILNKWSNGMWI